ncbi:MAG: DUF2339 domain-containing protein [Pontixanthobacter sp.]
MEVLILLLLGGAIVHLWRRSDALEAKLKTLDARIDGLHWHITHAPKAEDESAAQTPSVPPISEQRPVVTPQSSIPAHIPAPIPAMRRAAAKPAPAAPAISAEPTQPAQDNTAALQPKFQFTRPSFDFEDIFGRLLPIWAGGITLAIAGFFLVKYSIEAGLLGPQVRVLLGFVFGSALLVGAEAAYRAEERITDPRVRQALAGAGLATLFANFYLAGSLYGLVGNSIAFLGMAGVTGAAILLSFRFGLPSAILGLVGGFAAPMLVGSEEANLPLLALYLSLVTGGLTYAGNRQGRSWLALAALAGGLGWGVLMLFSSVTGFTDILAFGGYLVVLGAVVPALTEGKAAHPILRIGAAALTAIQMAAMVQQSGNSMLAWGLYGLLAAALAFFAWREPRMREANGFAAFVGLVMLALWWDASLVNFTIVAAGMTAIFAGVPLASIWHKSDRKIDSLQIALFVLGLIPLIVLKFSGEMSDYAVSGVIVALSLVPLAASRLQWPSIDGCLSIGALATTSSAAIGFAIAGLVALPEWTAPITLAFVTGALIALGWRRVDKGLYGLGWIGAAAMLAALLLTPDGAAEASKLSGVPVDTDLLHAILRWVAAASPLAALAVRGRPLIAIPAAEIGATILIYGLFAQFLPADALGWLSAAMLLGLTLGVQGRGSAKMTAAGISLLWAIAPALEWAAQGVFAFAGSPMLSASDFGWRTIGLHIAPFVASSAILVWRRPNGIDRSIAPFLTALGLSGAVGAHMAYKQIFAIETAEQFIRLGLAERTLWEALMLAAGWAISRIYSERDWARGVCAGLYSASLTHFAFFTAVLHNPLWSEQAVGSWPLVNLVLPAYLTGIVCTFLLAQSVSGLMAKLAPVAKLACDAALMLLIGLLCLTELRQIFAGSVLTSMEVGQTEDLLRSLLGIVVAIGFLLWGARNQSRSWRVGSLVLMLGAVLKVFLFDANGLEGLIRIVSFVALGFSLIGIGWFYARQLSREESA